MASLCLADELDDRMTKVMAKICEPVTLSDAKIKAIDNCGVGGIKMDPSSVQTCNEQEFGKISPNERRKKICGMKEEERQASLNNVSVNVF